MEINQIINLASHCLHLCNKSNMERIVFSCLEDVDIFVTNNTEVWKRKLYERGISCLIKKPEETKPMERIVVDGSSLGKDFEKWEKKWSSQKKAICIYNIEELDPLILKELVALHDKMILSTDKIRMVSDKHIEREIDELNPEIVENLVKRELKNILISLLLSEPMCGTDLVKIVYKKFRVFISPGMLYPTLHELEKKGLLKYDYKLKNKVYSVKEKSHAELLLKKHARVNSLLSDFLMVD